MVHLENIKSNITQILILIVGILIIISWMFVIVPDLKNSSSSFELKMQRISESSTVEKIGDPLPPTEPTRDTLSFEITNTDGNILEVQSVYQEHDAFTDELTWESIDIYYIDKNTRKHVDASEGYFTVLPYNIQKQNYIVNHPLVGNPTTFYFEGTEFIDDVEMYIFSCNDLDGDRTSTYPEFAPETIHSEHTCLVYFEPITGEPLSGVVTWYNYVIIDGERIPVDVGKSDTTSFAKDIRFKILKAKIKLFQFYDSVVPTFMLLTLGAVFSTSVYNKKSKEKGKIIKKQFQELKKADKTKTEFLRNLSHELRTPLVPIKGNVDMLRMPAMGELNEDQKESVDQIYEHTTHLLNTVENFLKLQKITENKLELKIQEIKIDELREIISKISLGDDTKKVTLETVFDKKLSVNADRSALTSIIKELIKNTTDFLPEQDGKIVVSIKKQNGDVIFSVNDNGSAIPKEKQTEIFKPFIKVDMSETRTHGGVGLGLAVCKGLIEGMGGKIWVESEAGKGTTFFFTIPKAV